MCNSSRKKGTNNSPQNHSRIPSLLFLQDIFTLKKWSHLHHRSNIKQRTDRSLHEWETWLVSSLCPFNSDFTPYCGWQVVQCTAKQGPACVAIFPTITAAKSDEDAWMKEGSSVRFVSVIGRSTFPLEWDHFPSWHKVTDFAGAHPT